MDKLDAQRRSENMRRIRSKDTAPELAVRLLLHSLGYRYRLHRKDLSGQTRHRVSKPLQGDFVHGCYWHAHGCKVAHTPKSNEAYWSPKLQRNVDRDVKNRIRLSELGWQSLDVWECSIKSHGIRTKIENFLRI